MYKNANLQHLYLYVADFRSRDMRMREIWSLLDCWGAFDEHVEKYPSFFSQSFIFLFISNTRCSSSINIEFVEKNHLLFHSNEPLYSK